MQTKPELPASIVALIDRLKSCRSCAERRARMREFADELRASGVSAREAVMRARDAVMSGVKGGRDVAS